MSVETTAPVESVSVVVIVPSLLPTSTPSLPPDTVSTVVIVLPEVGSIESVCVTRFVPFGVCVVVTVVVTGFPLVSVVVVVVTSVFVPLTILSPTLLYWFPLGSVAVIDVTPPILPVSDTLLLASKADAALIVVKARKTKEKIVKESYSKLVEARANVIGTILNESDKSLDNKYCGYYQEGKNKKGKNVSLLSPGLICAMLMSIVYMICIEFMTT